MAAFKAYSEIPFSCPFCWLCRRQGWARYPPHPGSIHPEVLSQPPLPRIYLSLFPHLKETIPRNEVGQQEERARCVPEDLRGGRELGSGARASCLHRDAQTACGTAYWIPWSEVGRICFSSVPRDSEPSRITLQEYCSIGNHRRFAGEKG